MIPPFFIRNADFLVQCLFFGIAMGMLIGKFRDYWSARRETKS